MDNDITDPKPVFTLLMRSLVGAQPETKTFFEMFCTQVLLSSVQHLLYQCIRAHFSLKETAAGSQIKKSSTASQTWQSDFSDHIPILKHLSLLCFTTCKDTPKTDCLGNQLIEISSLDFSVCIRIIHTLCVRMASNSVAEGSISCSTLLSGVTDFFSSGSWDLCFYWPQKDNLGTDIKCALYYLTGNSQWSGPCSMLALPKAIYFLCFVTQKVNQLK